jgi:hypothetical protein
MRSAFLLTIILMVAVCGVSNARAVRVCFGKSNDPQERLARAEFRRYFARMFTDTLDESEAIGYDLIIGTPESSGEIKWATDPERSREKRTPGRQAAFIETIPLPDGPNADQGYTIRSAAGSIYVVGQTGQGVLYGVYALLEQYGAYFQISGERLPERKPFEHRQFDIRQSPVFKYRGLLPWDNFACGMSGYSLEDYKKLIDRAVRMKFNMLQFHFYPGYAFFTETWNGKPVDPKCIGEPVDTFPTNGSVGESAFKGEAVFGAKPYVNNAGNPRAQAEAVQAMMRQVIDYAHIHGMKTCVGFELMYPVGSGFTYTDKSQDNRGGANLLNPLDPHNVELSAERYRTLVKTYPNSDFYWMWQSEARGYLSRNVGREPGAAEMRAKYAHWTERTDGAGDIDYAYLFREVANRLTPEERSRLATGGWGIEHVFPGADPDFPKEITFASLNSYQPADAQRTQVQSYRVAKTGRPAWMIEWWEFDGEEWSPQFRAGWQESMYKSCMEYGVQSVTLLGWKLSAIEHNVRYLSEFSWNPKLTAADFYAEYSRLLYGPGGEKLADFYAAYDKIETETPPIRPGAPKMFLSPGWEPMAPPSWPISIEALSSPAWRSRVEATPAHIQSLENMMAMDRKSIKVFEAALPKLDVQGRDWAELMTNRLQCRVLYAQSLIQIDEAVLAFDTAAKAKDLKAARSAAVKPTKTALALARRMIETYAQVIRNTGDQGLVAQLNEQFYRVIKGSLASLGATDTSLAKIDPSRSRFKALLPIDFGTWTPRDGAVKTTAFQDSGKPALRLEIGDSKTQFNSVFVRLDSIDLDTTPILDFKVRVTSSQPVAFMFQSSSGANWYALNLVGSQSGYLNLATLPPGRIDDGKWHRVTWDLRRLASERIGPGTTQIRQLIFGNWEKPPQTGTVEIKDFAFGTEQ